MGILIVGGCIYSENGTRGRFVVRSNDHWFLEQIQPYFGTKIETTTYPSRDKPQYRLRTSVAKIDIPTIDDVTDWPGFCRAVIELQGGITPIKQKDHHNVGLRIFGTEFLIDAVQHHLPILPKKSSTSQIVLIHSIQAGLVISVCKNATPPPFLTISTAIRRTSHFGSFGLIAQTEF